MRWKNWPRNARFKSEQVQDDQYALPDLFMLVRTTDRAMNMGRPVVTLCGTFGKAHDIKRGRREGRKEERKERKKRGQK